MTRYLGRTRWLPLAITVLSMGILGVTLYRGTLQLRDSIRTEMINHDGETLQTAVRMSQLESESEMDFGHELQSASGQLTLALKLTRLQEGVLAVRLYDPEGRFVAAVPRVTTGTDLGAGDLRSLSQLRPVSRFDPAVDLGELAPADGRVRSESSKVPLHVVLIPLSNPEKRQFLAAAQIITDGRGMAAEFARLDRALWREAALTYAMSGGLLAAALTWAFRRLRQTSLRLADQAAHLRRANQELVLAAKTSALGAVTAHLMHGLASPVTGLHSFVAARAGDDAESSAALRSAERLQAIVSETVGLLAEQDGSLSYQVPVAEMVEGLMNRVKGLALEAGVTVQTRVATTAALSNRDSQILSLVLENLLRNGVEATPRGKSVMLNIQPAVDGLLIAVKDEGSGMPETLRENLFSPCCSTKPGGHGIGLAISRQLARHSGAELDLVQNGSDGCVFCLRFPGSRLERSEEAAPQEAVHMVV